MEDQQERQEQTPQTEAADAETMRRLQEEIRNLAVSDHLLYMMQSLSTLAATRMGLTGDSSRRDMAQARLAIDAFKALMQLIEKERPRDIAPHRSMLSQLQLTYVEVLRAESEAGEGEQAPEPAPAAEPTATQQPDAPAAHAEPAAEKEQQAADSEPAAEGAQQAPEPAPAADEPEAAGQ